MKIKNIYKLLLITSIILLSSCVSQTNDNKVEEMIEKGNQAEFKKSYSDPIEYNDALVGIQMRYTILALAIEEYQGNKIDAVINTLSRAKELTKKGKPIAIILHTEMGNGVDYMMGTHKWHGSAPNDKQLAAALLQNPETLGDY